MTYTEILAISPQTWVQWADQRLHDAQYSLKHGRSPNSILVVLQKEAQKRIAAAKRERKLLKDSIKTKTTHQLVHHHAGLWREKLAALTNPSISDTMNP